MFKPFILHGKHSKQNTAVTIGAEAMSEANWCRLCLNSCSDFIILYDANGHCIAECYDILFKYFHPMLLTAAKGNQLTVLCLKCWYNVSEFHTFQTSILVAQKSLMQSGVIQVERYVANTAATVPTETISANRTNEIEISEEDACAIKDEDLALEATPDDEMTLSVCPNVEAPFAQKNEDDSYCDDDDDDSYQWCDEDYDDPVGIFTGGEFDNANKSLDLTPLKSDVTDLALSSDGENSMPVGLTKTTEKSTFLELEMINLASRSDDEPSVPDSLAKTTEKSTKNSDNMTEVADNTDALEESDAPSRMKNAASKQKHRRLKNCTDNGGRINKYESTVEKALRIHAEKEQLDVFIAQWRQTLECTVCHQPCPTYTLLSKHFAQHHPNEKCYIECCQRKYYNRFQIRDHVLHHMQPDELKCDSCNSVFKTEGDLKTHSPCSKLNAANTARGEKQLSVEKFGDILLNWEINLDCVVCGKTFPKFTLLRQHFQLDHPHDKLYIICCQRKHDTIPRIGDHALFHMDPKAFKCQVCGLCYKSSKYLYHHMYQVHCITKAGKEVESKYKCSHCERTYRRTTDLREHEAVHTGIDLYKCLYCPKTFKTRHRNYNHFKRDHPQEWLEGRKIKNNHQFKKIKYKTHL